MKTFFSILLVILAFLLRPPELTGQVDTAWVRIYDGPVFTDVSNASCSDLTGAVYLTGYSANPFHIDCLTVKYDNSGNLRWIRRYDGTGHEGDEANDIAIDDSANIYIAGFTRDTIPGNRATNALIMKYDSAGTLKWLQRWDAEPEYAEGGNVATHIAIDSARNIYVAGYYNAFNPSQGINFFLLKYSCDGLFQWAANYNGPGNGDDKPAAMVINKAGNIVVTGQSRQSIYLFTEDYATICYDPEGNEKWVRRYDGPLGYDDYPMAIATDDSCNIYVTGYTNYYSYKMLTIKYDSSGNERQTTRYAGFWDTRGNDIAIDPFRNIYVTGSHGDSYLTVKYASDWTVLWAREYYFPGGGGGGIRLLVTGDTGVIVAGTSVGDIATVRYDENGNLKWVHRFFGNGNSTDWVTDLSAGPSNSVYVTGTVTDSVNGNDFVAIKLIPAVNRYLKNLIVPYGVTRCFDAFDTITAAGNGTFFIVRSQGSATLIAGSTVFLLPGSIVEEGGYLYASIATNNQYCSSLFDPTYYYMPLPATHAAMTEKPKEDACFRVFPNPVHDRFRLELPDATEFPAGVVEIRTVTGSLVYEKFFSGQGEIGLSIGHLPDGLYFISYICGKACMTGKIIKY